METGFTTDMANCLMKRYINRIVAAVTMMMVLLFLSGCGSENRKQVFLTTGFKSNEIFITENTPCIYPEFEVYLNDIQQKYENVYGNQIWDSSVDGVTMEDNVKDNVLAHLSQIKGMNIMASQSDIELSETDYENIDNATRDYCATMSSDADDVTYDIIKNMYTEYTIANKLYDQMIENVNPEISDDEARTITVQHIFIKTYTTNAAGEKVDYSEGAKAIAYKKAEEILAFALDGEHEFEDLVMQYSDGAIGDYSFGKKATEPEFEAAAFNLGKDEISDIVETKYGYHIIKCISTFNREETDLNKIKLAEKMKEENFGEHFDEFAKTLTTNLNEELWNEISITPGNSINTQSFFEVYYKYFKQRGGLL